METFRSLIFDAGSCHVALAGLKLQTTQVDLELATAPLCLVLGLLTAMPPYLAMFRELESIYS